MPAPAVTLADVGGIPGQCRHCDAPVGGEHEYDCASLQPPLAQYRSALVWIPNVMGPYQAQVLVGQRWNGFLIPKFNLETARQIVRDYNELGLHPDLSPELNPVGAGVSMWLRWQFGEILCIRSEFVDGAVEPYDEFVEGPQYCIGARNWAWEEHNG